MRAMLVLTAAALVVASFLLCSCAQTPMTYAVPTSGGQGGALDPRALAAQSTGAVHTGLRATVGVEYDGQSLVGGRLDAPHASTIKKVLQDYLSLFGPAAGQVPFALTAPAAPVAAQSQAAPCGQWVTETRQVWVGE